MATSRQQIAEYITGRLHQNKSVLQHQYASSKDEIGYFFIDSLLPEELAQEIYRVFPEHNEMVLRKNMRETKYISAQMNLYNPLLEEVIYAFQDEEVVKLVGEICDIKEVFPDGHLYAGGISMMGHRQFLNPHLDNSHDKDRQRWRVLNLLYYVTPDWQESYGGNLELWPNGLSGKQVTIHSKFNRLAVMATHNSSLHSVSPVTFDGYRRCVSNYYFSEHPLQQTDAFHVTSFRGRPENKVTDMVLQADTWLRMMVRKLFKKGIKENPHVYRKDNN